MKKRLNNNGWGLSTMIGFMIVFVIFLIIIVFLTYTLDKKEKVVDFMVV